MTALRFALCHSSLALSLTAALGCEIDMSLGDLDDAASSSADGGPASSASSEGTGAAEGTSVDVPGTTAGTDDEADDTSGSTTASGDTEALTCDPPPEALWFDVDFDADASPESGELVVVADCVIQGEVEDGDLRTYAIECDEGGVAVPHTLEVTRSPGPVDLPLAAGTPIRLQVVRNYPIDTGGYRYVVVRDAAGELVLGWYSGGLVPDDLVPDVDAWFAPLEYALAFGDCEPEPYEDPGNPFIVDPCPAAVTRIALDFQLGDESIHLLDRTSGQLGPFSLFVTGARHLDPLGECPFMVDAFSFVAYREE